MKQKQLIREQFRNEVFERDGHKCKFCDTTEKLDAHHITDRNEMPNGGYVKENGITLCEIHHKQAEEYHRLNGENWVEGFHPEDLYDAIGSNYEEAVKTAKKGT